MTYINEDFEETYTSPVFDFFVREVVVTPDVQYAFNGSDTAVFTCIAAGDMISGVAWTVIPGDNNATVSVNGSYNSGTFTWQSELTVESAREDADYNCAASYSAGGKQADAATLNVIGKQSMIGPSKNVSSVYNTI